jgi:hypothetical protein
MTEAEWLVCGDPRPMLALLRGDDCGRKLQLFACACGRQLWKYIEDDRTRKAVEAGEAFADGLIGNDARRAATVGAHEVTSRFANISSLGANCARRTGHEAAAAVNAWLEYHRSRFPEATPPGRAELLRDIFGNPFQPATFDTAWRTSTAVALARGMYESREFGAMPILADALQDAGCNDEDVLSHCRGPGPHVRGCWVVDLVLGKA